MPLAPGTRIGSHVVVSLIGEGAMGEVNLHGWEAGIRTPTRWLRVTCSVHSQAACRDRVRTSNSRTSPHDPRKRRRVTFNAGFAMNA